MQDDNNCFHCGEPNPKGTKFTVQINGQQRCMCCPGCEAIAQTIVDSAEQEGHWT